MKIRSSQVKGYLISYPGYPASPNAFMPDNGLASLAGKLQSAGYGARVLDYGTITTMRRLIPDRYRGGLASIYARMGEINERKNARGGAFSVRDSVELAAQFMKLRSVTRKLEKEREKVEFAIAQEIAGMLRREEKAFIGFKLWNGDGFTGSIRIAQILRDKFPSMHIFAGGPQVKFFREFIFQETDVFDALAVGDGEATILPLAEVASGQGKLAEVPNIFYFTRGKAAYTYTETIQDMDTLPLPVYDLETYPSMLGDQKIKLVVIEDRRGCDNLCHFCSHPAISGHRPRSKSPERIVDEFEHVMRNYGISSFRLGGSSTPGSLLFAIAREIQRRGLKVDFSAFARVRDLEPEGLDELRRAGLYSLFFGIESGNQRVLDAMNKKVKVERMERVISASREAGIFTVGSVIYPAPFDDPATRKETLGLLERVRPDSVPLQFLGIYPGTEYARNPEKYNLQIVYPSLLKNILAALHLSKKPQYSDREILHYLIHYKILLHFPPRFWRPLPWRINDMGFRQFASQTQELHGELKRRGILTTLTDEEALMAHLARMPARTFAEETFREIFSGDWPGMFSVIKKINHKGEAADEPCLTPKEKDAILKKGKLFTVADKRVRMIENPEEAFAQNIRGSIEWIRNTILLVYEGTAVARGKTREEMIQSLSLEDEMMIDRVVNADFVFLVEGDKEPIDLLGVLTGKILDVPKVGKVLKFSEAMVRKEARGRKLEVVLGSMMALNGLKRVLADSGWIRGIRAMLFHGLPFYATTQSLRVIRDMMRLSDLSLLRVIHGKGLSPSQQRIVDFSSPGKDIDLKTGVETNAYGGRIAVTEEEEDVVVRRSSPVVDLPGFGALFASYVQRIKSDDRALKALMKKEVGERDRVHVIGNFSLWTALGIMFEKQLLFLMKRFFPRKDRSHR